MFVKPLTSILVANVVEFVRTLFQTVQIFNNLGWHFLLYPPYNPDLSKSKLLLFGIIKAFVRVTKLENDNETKSVVSK